MDNISIFNIEELKTVFVHRILKLFYVLSVPVMFISFSRIYYIGFQGVFLWFAILFGIPLLLFVFRNRLHYKTIIKIMLTVMVVTGIISFLNFSFFSTTLLYFFMSIILAILFLNKKTAWLLFVFFIVFLSMIFILNRMGYHNFSVDFTSYISLPATWATIISFFALFCVMFINLMHDFHYILYQQINQHKIQSDELSKAASKAEESDRLKTIFLQNMSHEIRTPMNAILGFSSLLNDPDLTCEKQAMYTKIISDRTNALLNVINDIMDISKMESGIVFVKERPGAVSMLFNEIDSYIKKVLSDNKDKEIVFRYYNKLTENHQTILADFALLNRVITIIIDNALKYTTKGSITCTAISSEQEIVFRIKDTGIGIPPDKIDIIFDRFRQAEESLVDSKFGGTGLGLSIAKKIIDLMGGTIWAENNADGGACISFSIPAKPTIL